ncbi:MAG: TPM domain-containing protein [Bacteroidales bacterium]|nr:TPM domain-containing protein [Bacteroidales bacterium]
MKKLYIFILFLLFANITFAMDNKDDWSDFVIAKRSERNLYVHKQFILDNLTQDKIDCALSTPYVDTTIKVYDVAGLLSNEEYSKIKHKVDAFINRNNIDMVILTINENWKQSGYGNNPSQNFAFDFYEYNDFGRGEKNINGYDGVIFIIDLQYRKFYVYDRGKPNEKFGVAMSNVDKYIQTMTPDLRIGNYYAAMSYLIDEYENDYIYEITFPVWKCILFSLILALILLLVEKSKYKNIYQATSAQNYIVPNSFKLTVKRDSFVRTFTTKTYNPPSSSGSGGRSSGSSGGSFGGGGGSF